jgi:uncharacterized protein
MTAQRALSVLVAIVAALPAAALEVPPLEGRIMDLAGLYSMSAASEMDRRLQTLEDETGAQVAVLTIPSLEGHSLEDFSMSVVESWELGGRERDNGLLILIARDDRKIRIEVGYGLEGVIPDILAGRIIDNAMKPAFRQGDFSGGTAKAVDLVDGLIRSDPEAAQALAEPAGRSADAIPLIAMGAIFLSVIGVFATTALFSKGAGGWFLYLFLIPFFFAFPGAMLGGKWGLIIVAAWLIGFPILRAIIWHTGVGEDFRTTHPKWTTWSSSGGGWSSGGGGWSGGGGGFSGGGGSFGGGGASGGW